MWPFDQIGAALERRRQAQAAQELALRQLIERTSQTCGFTREVWLDEEDLYGRYSALPGHTMSASMISAAEDDFRRALRYLSYTSGYSSSMHMTLGSKSIYHGRTSRELVDDQNVRSVTFIGGYEYTARRGHVEFDADSALQDSLSVLSHDTAHLTCKFCGHTLTSADQGSCTKCGASI